MILATPSPSSALSIEVGCRPSDSQDAGSSSSGNTLPAFWNFQGDLIRIQTGIQTPLVEYERSTFPLKSESTRFLQRRQTNLCSTNCATYRRCSPNSLPAPAIDDCNKIINSIKSQGDRTMVLPPLNFVLQTYKSCSIRVDNIRSDAITWCYSSWADQSVTLMGCFPSRGSGTCALDGISLSVGLADDYVFPNSTSTTPNDAQPSTTTDESPSSTSSSDSNHARESTTTSSTRTVTPTTTTTTRTGTSVTTTPGISTLTSMSVPLPDVDETLGTRASTGTQSIPSAPGSEGITPGLGDHQGRTIAVVIGSVTGIIALLALLALCIWRMRRAGRGSLSMRDGDGWRKMSKKEEQPEPFIIPTDPSHESMSSMRDLIATQKAVLPTSDAKMDFSQWDRKIATMSPSDTFDVQLVTNNTTTNPVEVGDRPLIASSRESNGSTQVYQQFEPQQRIEGPETTATVTPHDVVHDQLDLPHAVAVRRMTQRLAPDLSEHDLDRLAENIIARMQGTITTPPDLWRPDSVLNEQLRGGVAGSEGEDPPPPWRESWNSSRRGGLLER